MTEQDWPASDRPDELLMHRRDRLDDRDLRRLAAAFARRAWEHMGDASRQAVEAAERFASGDEPEPDFLRASRAAADALREALRVLDIHIARNGHRYHAAYAAAAACWHPNVPLERDPRRGEPEGLLDATIRAASHAAGSVAIAKVQHIRPVTAMHERLHEAERAESRAQARMVRMWIPGGPSSSRDGVEAPHGENSEGPLAEAPPQSLD